jgi:Tfp pilus assembly protein PilN
MSLLVNLLPKAYRPKPSLRAWPVILAVIFLVNVLGMGLFWGFLQLDLASIRTDIQLKENQIRQLDRQVKDAEAAAVLEAKVKAKAAFIDKALISSPHWQPLFEAIERALLPGVRLTSITATANGTVSIFGYCDTAKSVADFMGSLQAETGLDVIRITRIIPGVEFDIVLEGWSGWGDGNE